MGRNSTGGFECLLLFSWARSRPWSQSEHSDRPQSSPFQIGAYPIRYSETKHAEVASLPLLIVRPADNLNIGQLGDYTPPTEVQLMSHPKPRKTKATPLIGFMGLY